MDDTYLQSRKSGGWGREIIQKRKLFSEAMERVEYQGGDSGKPLTPDHFDTACSLEKTHVSKIGDLVHLDILRAG
ncbi:hypothetical protein CFP56_027543 [Quercus suber]|uniref:Uncharacterized protein n=1 Tax=Quercus suber TaxID=58331 RepID=A0AAW0JYI8_QUESU